MTIQYKTKGVCSKQMNVKLDDDGVVRAVEGMKAQDAIDKMAGIKCAYKQTSCPDQLSKALTIALKEQQKRAQA